MIGSTTTTEPTACQAAPRDDGYDMELSIRTMSELRAHVPDVDEAVFRGLENLHLLDRTLGADAWQHYHRFHATPDALVAVRVTTTGPTEVERREAIPYDDLIGDPQALLAGTRREERTNGQPEPHRLLPQFRRAMAAYSALTAFERDCEATTGSALPDSGATIN